MKKIEIKHENKKTGKIEIKQYIPVHERILYFRENYPEYSLSTEIIKLDDVAIFKAIIRNPNEIIVATGHAYERENSSFINKTSYIENCETSAIGRALGNFGIGVDTTLASFEEVANATLNQNQSAVKVRIKYWEDQLNHAVDLDQLKNIFTNAVHECLKAKDKDAEKRFTAMKDIRKQELQESKPIECVNTNDNTDLTKMPSQNSSCPPMKGVTNETLRNIS